MLHLRTGGAAAYELKVSVEDRMSENLYAFRAKRVLCRRTGVYPAVGSTVGL